MSQPKRHHFLPETYQRGFLSDEGYIWVYEKGGHEPRPQQPKDTGVIKHYYRITLADGSTDSSLETQAFSKLDDLWKPLYDTICRDPEGLSAENLISFLLFAAFLYVRVPRTQNAVQELARATAIETVNVLANSGPELSMVYDQLLQQSKIPASFSMEDLRMLITDVDKQFNVSINRDFVLLTTLQVADDVLSQLLTMSMAILPAPPGVQFITSDCPVVPFVPLQGGQAKIGAGFDLPGAEVTLPISPALCAYLCRDRKPPPSLQEINNRTAFCAEKEIYASNREQWVIDLADQFGYSKEIPKIERAEVQKWVKEKYGQKPT